MIDEEPLSQFHLRLAAPEGDAEELDDLTRNLFNEMQDAAEDVNLVPGGDVPEGAKGALVTAQGELNVTLKPALLPRFLDGVRDWLSRQNQRVEVVATIGNSTFHINASLTDMPAIMQALGNLNASQGMPVSASSAIANRAGGADLSADQINVGGDVTGRDKIISIHAEAGATVYIGPTSAAPIKIDDGATQSASQAPDS